MEKIFGEILSMSVDSAWLIVAVIIVRALLQKSPMYFRKILWGLVGLRLVIPFSFKSVLSLVPDKIPQTADSVAGQVVAATTKEGLSFADIVPILWAVVVVAFLLYGSISYIKLKLRIVDGVLIRRNIYQSEKIQSPFVCGFIKPKIYVPYGLDEATLNCVLHHEETHIRYADHIIKAFSFIVLCIHWFNPLVWVSYFLLCKDIELSCDESVIKKYNADQCKKYAKALLDLGVSRVALSACPIAFGEVSIKTRIKSVIKYKKASKLLVFASLAICIGVSLCFMTEPEAPLKEALKEDIEVVEETTEPTTEHAKEPTTEPTTEPSTKAETEPLTNRPAQSVVAQQEKPAATTEEVFDDSMFENEDDGLESDSLNRINIQEPDLVDPPNPTSPYEGVAYNNFGSNSSGIGNKPGSTVELPTVSLPADPTPTVNYHHTRPYNPYDPNSQFYMW